MSLLDFLFDSNSPIKLPSKKLDRSRETERVVVVKRNGRLIKYRINPYGEIFEEGETSQQSL